MRPGTGLSESDDGPGLPVGKAGSATPRRVLRARGHRVPPGGRGGPARGKRRGPVVLEGRGRPAR